MARKSDSLCMFCSSAPCACDNQKPKKPKKPSFTKKASSVSKGSDNEKSDQVEPVQEEYFGDIPEKKSKFHAKSKAEKSEKDLEMIPALILLRSIVSDRSRREIDDILNPRYERDLDKRIHDFKRSRNEAQSTREA